MKQGALGSIRAVISDKDYAKLLEKIERTKMPVEKYWKQKPVEGKKRERKKR